MYIQNVTVKLTEIQTIKVYRTSKYKAAVNYASLYTNHIPSRKGNISSGLTCPRNKFIAKELVSDILLSTVSAALAFMPATHSQHL